MESSADTWFVFVVAFVASAATLARLFISGEEFRALTQPGAERAKREDAEAKRKAEEKAHKEKAAAMEKAAAEKAAALAAQAEKEAEEAEGADGETARDTTVALMRFLEGSLTMLGDRKLDSFNRFGCHLFMAGASESIASGAGLGQKQMFKLLAEAVSVLGQGRAAAQQFSDKYEEYLLEPKYVEMFKSGRGAMDRFLNGGPDALGGLAGALEFWNQPDTEEEEEQTEKGPTTVMFTDIVGSTRMTQTQGDAGAQELVRKHNEIVRGALQAHEGLEIKHTGDGIMASFKNTSKAIHSAVQMQRGFATHNAEHPDRELNIRIGVNAGQPIHEDGDLFGTTVQLAARICDKADSGQILASNVVREICAGGTIRFEQAGEFAMKGIEEPVSTFQVPWSDT